MKLLLSTIILLLCPSLLLGNASLCGRTALIDNQEILIDTNSTDKGAGLRYHLEKDPLAKLYFEEYQRKSSNIWPSTIIGTTGTLLTLSSFFVQNDSTNKQALLVTGLSTLIINFLVHKTLEVKNEELLNISINEYNKRNMPKIYLSPVEKGKSISIINYTKGF